MKFRRRAFSSVSSIQKQLENDNENFGQSIGGGILNFTEGKDGGTLDQIGETISAPMTELYKLTGGLSYLADKALGNEEEAQRALEAVQRYSMEQYGVNADGSVAMNDAAMLTGSIGAYAPARGAVTLAGSSISSMAKNAAERVLGRKMLASNVLTTGEKSLKRKALEGTGEIGFASSLAPFQDQEGTIDNQGQFKSQSDILDDPKMFAQSMAMDALGSGIIDIGVVKSVNTVNNLSVNHKLRKQYDKSEFSTFADKEIQDTIVQSLNEDAYEAVSKMQDNPNAPRIKENGLISVDEKAFETLRKNKGDQGALINEATGDIIIKSKGLGTLIGRLDDAGNIVIDHKQSDISTKALKMKYKNQRVFKFADEGTRSIYRNAFKEVEEAKREQNYTTPEKAKANKEAIIEGLKQTIGENGPTWTSSNPDVANNSSVRKIEEVLSNPNNKAKINGIVEKFIEQINSGFQILKNKRNSGLTENAKTSELIEAIYDMAVTSNLGETTALPSAVKDKFRKALEKVTTKNLMSLKLDENGNIPPETSSKSLTKEILRETFDLMDIDFRETGLTLDGFINGLDENNLNSIYKFRDLTEVDGIKDINTKTTSDYLKGIVDVITNEVDKKTFSEEFNKLIKADKGITKGKSGKINGLDPKDIYVPSQAVMAAAKRAANHKRTINKDLYNKVEEIIGSYTDKELASMLKEVNSESHPNIAEGQFTDIKGLREELKQIKELMESGEFNLDVEIQSSLRINYKGALNPHSSKLLRYLQRIEGRQDIDLNNKTNLDIVNAHIADTLSDDIKLDTDPENARKTLKTLDNIKPDSVEGLLVKAQTELALKSIINGKNTIDFTIAADSTNNNLVLAEALLGITDSEFGTNITTDGTYKAKEDTLPSKIQEIFKRNGFEISRQEAKGLSTPFLYMSSIKGARKAFAKSYISTILKKSVKDRKASLTDSFRNTIEKYKFDEYQILQSIDNKEKDFIKVKEAFENAKAKLDEESSQANVEAYNKAKAELITKYTKGSEKYKAFKESMEGKILEAYENLFENNKRLDQDVFDANIETLSYHFQKDARLKKIAIESYNAMPKDVMYFMQALEATLQNSKHAFISRINESNIDRNILNVLAEKYGWSSEKVDSLLGKRDAISIKELIEKGGTNEIFIDNKSLFKIKEIRDKFKDIEVMNPFGDSITFDQFLGNQTFISEQGIVVPGLNMASIMTPIYIQSIEASIASRFYGEKIENVFDAIYGGREVIDGAVAANQTLVALVKNTNMGNGFKLIKEMLDRQPSTLTMQNHGDLVKQIIIDEHIKNKGRPPESVSKQDIEIKMKEMNETVSKIRESIEEKIKEVENRKLKLESKNVESGNFATGSFKHNGGFNQKVADSIKQDYLKETKSNTSRIGKLKNVIVSSKNDSISRIFDYATGVVKRIINVEFGDTSSAILNGKGKGITITLDSKIKNIKTMSDFKNALAHIVHESVHATEYVLSNKRDKFGSFMKSFSGFIRENTDGRYNTGDVSETFSMIMERTVANDALQNIKLYLANKFRTSDLTDLYFGDLDGKLQTIESAQHLRNAYENYLRNNKVKPEIIKSMMNEFDAAVETTKQILNQKDIVDVLQGIEPSEKKVLKSSLDSNAFTSRMVKLAKERSKIVNSVMTEMTVFDMFALDMSTRREAMNKIAGLQKGKLLANIEATTASVRKVFEELDKTLNTKQDAERFKTTLGNLTNLGFHLLDYTKIENIESLMVELNKIKKEFKDHFSEGYRNKKKPKDDATVKEAYNSFVKNLQRIAEGRSYGKLTIDSMTQRLMRVTGEDFINYDVRRAQVERMVAALRVEKYKDTPGGTVSRYFDMIGETRYKAYADEAFSIFNRNKNSSNIFGVNLEINLSKTRRGVKAILLTPENRSEMESLYKKNILGKGFDDKSGNEYLIVAKKSSSYISGSQKSHIVDFDLDIKSNAYETGNIVKIGKNFTVVLKPSQMKTSSSYINTSIDVQVARNVYHNMHKQMARDIAKEQFQLAVDNGIILDEESIISENEAGRNMSDWKELSASHPFSKMAGGKMFYNTKHEHLIYDTKGFDIRSFTKQLGSMNNIVFHILRGTMDLVKGARSFILLSRIGGYLNNIVGNSLQYMMHAANPATITSDFVWAYKQTKDFRDKLDARNRAFVKGKDVTKMDEEIANHPVYQAFNDGLFSTLRNDAYLTGSYEEMSILADLRKFDKSGVISDVIKNITFDPTSKFGNVGGQIFDATEMIPKLALWKNLESSMDPSQRSQYIQMAFPTYENLPPIMNIMDQFFPYTKYMMNYPKIIMFTMNRSLASMLALNAALPAAAMMSWNGYEGEEGKKEFFKENGFIHLGDWGFGSTALYWESMFMPYLNISAATEKTGFVPYAYYKAFKDIPSWVIPGTIID